MKLKLLLATSTLIIAGNIFAQNVGISTSSPKSKLDVNGGLSVGTYAGVNAAPTNGAIISGNVGIGTTAPLYKWHLIHTSNTDGIIIQNTTGGAGSSANIYLATYADATAGTSRPGAKITALDDASYSAHITFSTKAPGADANAMTERVRIASIGNVGIGTTSIPTETMLAIGATSNGEGGQIQLNSASGYTQAYFIDVYQNRMRVLLGTNTGSTTEMARIVTDGSTGSYSQFNGQIIGTAFAATNIETIFDGQGLSDNVYHTLSHTTGYAMTGISVYAASYFDGNTRLSGSFLGNVLGSTVTWYGNNGASTQGVTCSNGANVSNTKGPDQDNTWHWAACPDNYVATGFEIWASGSYFDGCLKLRCTALNTGFATTNNTNNSINTNGGSNPNTNNNTASLANMNGVETAFNTPWNTGYDNCYHTTFCPVGTFVRGIKMYAGSQVDGNMSVFCTGIKAN